MFSLHFFVVSITLLRPILFVNQPSLSFRLRVVFFGLVVVVVVILSSVSRPQDRVLLTGFFFPFRSQGFLYGYFLAPAVARFERRAVTPTCCQVFGGFSLNLCREFYCGRHSRSCHVLNTPDSRREVCTCICIAIIRPHFHHLTFSRDFVFPTTSPSHLWTS